MLKQPATKEDPERVRLKKGFGVCLDQTKTQMREALEEFSDLSAGEVRELDAVVANAAKMWIDFETQRYRVVVSLPGANVREQIQKVELAQQETLMLTLAPTVKRYGNAKGFSLDLTDTVFGGGEQDVVAVSIPA